MNELREKLIEALRRANINEEHARQVFSAPYSSQKSTEAMYETRGIRLGLGIALEILDSHMNLHLPVDKV